MKKLYVTKIEETDNGIQGSTIEDQDIVDNFNTIFTDLQAIAIYNQAKAHNNQVFLFYRVCQFIVFVQHTNVGWVMTFMDFEDSTDKFLDEYNRLAGIEMSKEQLADMITLFKEIQEDSERAELIKR